MVAEQLTVPWRGITDTDVLAAMRTVPRHEFVPPELRHLAYEDQPLPIGHGQTISQPFIVAYMTQAIAPRRADRILEVGTGSGYQAAVLGQLAREVFSIEIVEPLARGASAALARVGITNVHVRTGDAWTGWHEHAPFDAIIVTCAPERVPPPLIAQLKDGGRMIIPVGVLPEQQLHFLEKQNGEIIERLILGVRFVPMTGRAAQSAEEE
jgi:protein-L-isoaspartate(D-aspartate) O-methyltransferase